MTPYENVQTLLREYPNLLVTNVKCSGEQSDFDVFLYDKRYVKRGKRLAEVHYKHTKDIYHLVFKKDICTPSEVSEMEGNNYGDGKQGYIKRVLSEKELLDFLREKLNKTTLINN